ncbi:MAG: response regulator [Bryobacterales bacterium]|nr:response regulator [Bryobacterales bacterium]
MSRNLSRESLSVTAACAQLPSPMEVDAENRESRQERKQAVTDVLSIGANPTLAIYLAGLFAKYGWTVRRSANLEDARAYLADHRAAVVVCDEALPDAAWQDALGALKAIPDAPMFVLIGSEKTLLGEALALGGFDAVIRPLREAEVIWTVASAWHQWMKRFEDLDSGGAPCSDA